jgi:hypothetical protein
MSILAIDTVGAGSSIAIIDHDDNCFVEHNSTSKSHAETFFQILNTLFNKHDYNDKIDHLVVHPTINININISVSVKIEGIIKKEAKNIELSLIFLAEKSGLLV